jgi:high affinity Mn2+ porin
LLASSPPETALVRRYSSRTGVLLNFEQELSPSVGLFARFSQNSPGKETFEFTDINQSTSTGLSIKGELWGRTNDMVGLAWVQNRIFNSAQQYFSNGGMGVLIGDGSLNYAPESTTEMYYGWQMLPNVNLSFNFQRMHNPAYNQDRGPINFTALRLHASF